MKKSAKKNVKGNYSYQCSMMFWDVLTAIETKYRYFSGLSTILLNIGKGNVDKRRKLIKFDLT